MRFDERGDVEKARDTLRATIEEIAKAKGITFEEALRRCIAVVEGMVLPKPPSEPPPTPTPAAPARHLPIDDSGAAGCVAWCPACRDARYAREAVGR